jgi:hypothetical protein
MRLYTKVSVRVLTLVAEGTLTGRRRRFTPT